MLMTIPFMSMCLSAMNSAAGQALVFWTAEMHCQQTAMVNEMTKQVWPFWAEAWRLPTAGK
jgi:hypothetical protein